MFFNIGFNNISIRNNFFGGCCSPIMPCGFNSFNPFAFSAGYNNGFNFGFLTSMMNPSFSMPSFNTMPSIFGFGGLNSFGSANLTLPQFNFSSMQNAFAMPNSNYQIDSPFTEELMTQIPDFSIDYSSINTKHTKSKKTSETSDFKNISKLDKNFLNGVKKVSDNIGCDYRDLLAVMNSESGVNPKAQHKNKQGKVTAVGLIQFTQIAIDDLNKNHGLNLTLDSIYNMTPGEQLDIVEKYFLNAKKRLGKSTLSAGDLYAITYLPARAKNEVLAKKGEDYYTQNKGLDINNDGKITKSDLTQRVQEKRVNISMFA